MDCSNILFLICWFETLQYIIVHLVNLEQFNILLFIWLTCNNLIYYCSFNWLGKIQYIIFVEIKGNNPIYCFIEIEGNNPIYCFSWDRREQSNIWFSFGWRWNNPIYGFHLVDFETIQYIVLVKIEGDNPIYCFCWDKREQSNILF